MALNLLFRSTLNLSDNQWILGVLWVIRSLPALWKKLSSFFSFQLVSWRIPVPPNSRGFNNVWIAAFVWVVYDYLISIEDEVRTETIIAI